MVVPVLSLLLPLGAYGALTAVGVDGNKAGILMRRCRLIANYDTTRATIVVRVPVLSTPFTLRPAKHLVGDYHEL